MAVSHNAETNYYAETNLMGVLSYTQLFSKLNMRGFFKTDAYHKAAEANHDNERRGKRPFVNKHRH